MAAAAERRDRVPALVAARRHRQGGRHGHGRAGRRRGGGARRLAAAGRARLAAGAQPDDDPDPRLVAAGDDRRLRARGRARADATTSAARSRTRWASDRLRRPLPAAGGRRRRRRADRGRVGRRPHGDAADPGLRRACSRSPASTRRSSSGGSGCRTPERVAALLAGAAGGAPRCACSTPAPGTASRATRSPRAGLDPVVGLDLEPAARDAPCATAPAATALPGRGPRRARAGGGGGDPRRAAAGARLRRLGRRGPPPARGGPRRAATLLEPPALLAYAFDVGRGPTRCGTLAGVPELARERYVHRRTVTGGERVWEAVVSASGPARIAESG